MIYTATQIRQTIFVFICSYYGQKFLRANKNKVRILALKEQKRVVQLHHS